MSYHQSFIEDFLAKKLATCQKVQEPHFVTILKFITGGGVLEEKRLAASDFVALQIRLSQRHGSIENTKIWRHVLDMIAPPLVEVVPANQISLF